MITIIDKGSNRHEIEDSIGIKIKTLVKLDIKPEGVDVSFEVD